MEFGGINKTQNIPFILLCLGFLAIVVLLVSFHPNQSNQLRTCRFRVSPASLLRKHLSECQETITRRNEKEDFYLRGNTHRFTWKGVCTPYKPYMTIKMKPLFKSIWKRGCSDGSIPTQRLPEFIIISEGKTGTGALLQFASLNPSLSGAVDEPHYFDNDSRYECGMSFYKSILTPACGGEMVFEKTPTYFHHLEVPSRIKHMNNDMKLVAMFREPVERTVSHYLQWRATKGCDIPGKTQHCLTFEDHVFNSDGSVNADSVFVKSSVYAPSLRRWLRYFPRKQFLLMESTEISEAPQQVLRRLEKFVGSKERVEDYVKFYFNETRGFYCYRTKDNKNHCMNNSKGRSHPDYDPKLLNRLASYFRPYNKELFHILGKPYNWTRSY